MRWEITQKLEKKEELLPKLLEIREISDKEQEYFLNPVNSETLIEKFDGEINESLQKAKTIISNTMEKGNPIVIHGDYDADGICATTILAYTIRKILKYDNVHTFIPNRFKNSYGITTSSVDECVSKCTKSTDNFEGLLISVDTGITANDAVDYAHTRGFKVIITDHHQKPKLLPKAECIVWTDILVGSGVSWILSSYLGLKDNNMKSLVALATVTDLQPVLGINRSLVKEGLEEINNNPSIGLKALLEVSGRYGNEITTYDLGWVLGPRLNATGRISDANIVLDLLLEENYDHALELAKTINASNIDRQDKTEAMYNVVALLDKTNLPKIILTVDDEYHEGIIGLIAARLVQEYYRPSIVISLNNGIGKGSVRSVKGLDIITFLRKFEDLFESLGGHPMAAGFSIKEENISILQKLIIEEAEKTVDEKILQPFLDIDLEIPIQFVDLEFLLEIESMKPFGVGNRAPMFVSKQVGIVGLNIVGKTQSHLSLKLTKDNRYYKGILFNQAALFSNLKVGDLVDIAYSIEKNVYNGITYVNLILKDIALSGSL